jgi:hypothetical protein
MSMRKLLIYIAFASFLVLTTACDFGEDYCNTDYKYYRLTSDQKQKFIYGGKSITMTFSDSTGTQSIDLVPSLTENFMYSNEYDPGHRMCSTIHDAEIIRKKYQSADLKHKLQVSLFTEEYIGFSATGTQYAKTAALNSFIFEVDSFKLYVPEGALGVSSSQVLENYEIKVGKDTVLATFGGSILQSVDYKKKGLKWEFK